MRARRLGTEAAASMPSGWRSRWTRRITIRCCGPRYGKYLNRQRTLVDLQIKHFDEEHTLAIAAARRKGFIDRMRICLQVLVAAVIGGRRSSPSSRCSWTPSMTGAS